MEQEKKITVVGAGNVGLLLPHLAGFQKETWRCGAGRYRRRRGRKVRL